MLKGTLKTVEGDVTNPQRIEPEEIVIIPHCCNDLKVMGAGVALSLKKKWPGVEDTYKTSSMALGSISYFTHVSNSKVDLIVANMIGQSGLVSNNNSKPVKYWALAIAMDKVCGFYDSLSLGYPGKKIVIHCPKFGSDLAGGDWNFILELINELWIDKGIDVVVYEFVPQNMKDRKKKTLFRTDITIWTDGDTFGNYPDLETLARDAERGDAYCSKQKCTQVDDIYLNAPDGVYDGINEFFFGYDKED